MFSNIAFQLGAFNNSIQDMLAGHSLTFSNTSFSTYKLFVTFCPKASLLYSLRFLKLICNLLRCYEQPDVHLQEF